MIAGRVASGLGWIVCAAVWLVAAVSASELLPEQPTSAVAPMAAPDEPVAFDTGVLNISIVEVQQRDPFRLERTPSRVRFLPWPVADDTVAERPQRAVPPSLALVGVLAGATVQVVVEGVPGRERGILLRRGEEVGGVRLVRISGDTVVLAGFDTLWTFTQARVRP